VDVLVWQATSLLLSYPDQRFYDRRPMLRAALSDVPQGTATLLLGDFLDHVDRTPLLRLRIDYAEALRLGGLRLTRAGGGTRRAVLARLDALYASAGCGADEGEAADFLPVVLEYVAWCADNWLLLEHRAALEDLRDALAAHATPYAALVEAVCATLPKR
jgi:nitrate reductase molybdenum cofactor assembly chaperone NarJ/NarW